MKKLGMIFSDDVPAGSADIWGVKYQGARTPGALSLSQSIKGPGARESSHIAVWLSLDLPVPWQLSLRQ